MQRHSTCGALKRRCHGISRLGTLHTFSKKACTPCPHSMKTPITPPAILRLVDLSRHHPRRGSNKNLEYAKLSAHSLRQSLPDDTYNRLVQAGMLYGMPGAKMQDFKPMLAFQQSQRYGVSHAATSLTQFRR